MEELTSSIITAKEARKKAIEKSYSLLDEERKGFFDRIMIGIKTRISLASTGAPGYGVTVEFSDSNGWGKMRNLHFIYPIIDLLVLAGYTIDYSTNDRLLISWALK